MDEKAQAGSKDIPGHGYGGLDAIEDHYACSQYEPYIYVECKLDYDVWLCYCGKLVTAMCWAPALLGQNLM